MEQLWYGVYARIDLKKCTVRIQDGSNPAKHVDCEIADGTVSYDETRTIEYLLERGLIDEVREGDQVPVDVSFEFKWTYLVHRNSGACTIEEAIKGTFTGWTSSDSDACRPYAVDIVVIYQPSPSTCGDQEVYTFPDFGWVKLAHSFNDAKVAVTGKCNTNVITPIRGANS